MVILFSWIATFIIPKGAYERQIDNTTNQSIVVPDSYQEISTDSLTFFDVLLAIPKGITERANLIVLVLLLGGCFYVIEKTGAFNQGLNQLIRILNGKEILALLALNFFFLTGGFFIGLQEEIIAMVPILLIFCKSIGYHKNAILFASYGAAILGAAFSPFNPFGVIIAQREAEVPLLSGLEFRLVIFAIAALIWTLYLVYYASKNKVPKEIIKVEKDKLTPRNKGILLLLAITFGIVSYGLIELSWGFNEMSGCFFILGIASGLIAKLSINKTTELYVEGFKEMVFACIIIGLANSITLILSEGKIIDTIVYGLFTPLQHLSPSTSGVLMLFSHSILHFPLPSYSGQAILTMPILTPLSDLIGLSRQVTVLAYQYGTIMMDVIIPTNGALMAIIALANITYKDWLKFILKPFFILLIFAAISIVVAVNIGI